MAKAIVTEDYYTILEVSQFASLETIRESYKKLALKFHPDKNKEESATSDFQLLVKAWETLRDGAKRAEYNKTFVKVSKRKREDVARDEDERLRTRREEFEKEAKIRWEKEENLTSTLSLDEARRREAVKAWQAIAKEDYLSRLQRWIEFRNQRIPEILETQRLLSQQEGNLYAQTAEGEEGAIRRFQDAIVRSCSAGRKVEDPTTTLRRLLEARRSYISKLAGAFAESRERLEQLLLKLKNDRRRYEGEETKARNLRIRRALELLGPRDLNAPLFSLIDRRGKAINCWKALSRIEPAANFTSALGPINEGPWHIPGDWEHVTGEQTCGRCGKGAFNLIPECSPSKCPGCGMIACINCHRSLKLLQEYEQWITSSLDTEKEYLFSVVFDTGSRTSRTRGDFGSPFDTSRM